MKQILFVGDAVGATYGIAVRGMIYRDYLEENGWQCKFVSCTRRRIWHNLFHDSKPLFKRQDEIIALAKESQIVYFIKIIDETLVWRIHNETNAILLYDFYDIFWKDYKYECNAILDLMDGLVTEGSYLCDFLARYRKPVFGINGACVYEEYQDYKPKGNKVIIGWLGSRSTMKAVNSVAEALERIGQKHSEVELRLVGTGGQNISFQNIKVTYCAEYNHQEMINELFGFDIGIFPPPSDDFDYLVRGPHKGVRYMGAGRPAVFYDYGDCKQFVRDMENAVLYKDAAEFEEKVNLLIENEELRRKIGKAGYETVYPLYSVKGCAQSLLNVLEAMCLIYIPRFHL